MSVSTHVLDAVAGRPAAGIRVVLEARREGGWDHVAAGVTDAEGRVADLAPTIVPGVHRLQFEVDHYFGAPSFYPEVVVVFRVTDAAAHYHVPLLLSPFAYSTYRGS